MGLLKGCAKVVGSVVLGATGVASTVLKGVFDTAGIELGSEVFGAAKDASFNGIKRMWDSGQEPAEVDTEYSVDDMKQAEIDELKRLKTKARSNALRFKEWAKAAEKAGNQEKYEMFMGRYEACNEEAASYDEEILKVRYRPIDEYLGGEE